MKRIVLKKLESFLFFVESRAPLVVTLLLARLLRKLLFRETMIETSPFKDFDAYREFVVSFGEGNTARGSSVYGSVLNCGPELDDFVPNVAKEKIFFICCDGKQNSSRNLPSTFLDVWRDTACEAGLIVKVSIANEYMYNINLDSSSDKDEYVNRVIDEIIDFEADLVFFDANYVPNECSLNLKDFKKIRNKTNVPICGHIGDFIDQNGINCAKTWLTALDRVFHSNVDLLHLDINGLHYVPYTCSTERYYPEKDKNIPIFFSGISNISRLWYLLIVQKFTNDFLPNSQISFFRSTEKSAASFIDQQKYDSMVRKSHAILDLTHRSRKIQNTSGRMFQALASETVLLAEECSTLNKLIKPFIEYLPFKNGMELKYALTLLRDEPDLCKVIAARGAEKFEEKYSPQKIWAEIIYKNNISG